MAAIDDVVDLDAIDDVVDLDAIDDVVELDAASEGAADPSIAAAIASQEHLRTAQASMPRFRALLEMPDDKYSSAVLGGAAQGRA